MVALQSTLPITVCKLCVFMYVSVFMDVCLCVYGCMDMYSEMLIDVVALQSTLPITVCKLCVFMYVCVCIDLWICIVKCR